MKKKTGWILMGIILCISCNSYKKTTKTAEEYNYLSVSDKRMLDSILQKGLDSEALYTMLGSIKPMSSVIMFRLPIANTDSTKKTKGDVIDADKNRAYLNRMAQMQKVINTLNFTDLKFVLSPFVLTTKRSRFFQLNVVRISTLDSLLKAKENFFGQFGLVPGTDPSIVISTIESSDRYERLRGYGYLFGYPEYAVDFYVDGSEEFDNTKKHVDRNFFQIPVYSRPTGSFVYAYPKKHVPTVDIDSAIYHRSINVLEMYKQIRPDYLSPDTTLHAFQLLYDLTTAKSKTK